MIDRLPEPPQGVITLWVIYDHPRDYPEHCVLRRQFVCRGGTLLLEPEFRLAASIEALRELLPPGVTRFPLPDPDPAIAEVWFCPDGFGWPL